MKIVKMTTKGLEYYTNLVKAVVGFERTDGNFENSTVGKMLSNSNPWNREILCEGIFIKRNKISHFILLFWEFATASLAFSSHHLSQSGGINVEARPSPSKNDYNSLKAQMMGSTF